RVRHIPQMPQPNVRIHRLPPKLLSVQVYPMQQLDSREPRLDSGYAWVNNGNAFYTFATDAPTVSCAITRSLRRAIPPCALPARLRDRQFGGGSLCRRR